jgi:hypothetical protein
VKRIGESAAKNSFHSRQYSAPQKSPIPLVSFSTRHARSIALYDWRRLIQIDRRRAFPEPSSGRVLSH